MHALPTGRGIPPRASLGSSGVALLQEEVAGDLAAAKATYLEIRRLEPSRRSALMFLQSAAARAGDADAFAAALLDEAALAPDADAAIGARRRAAEALSRTDPERALRLLEDILRQKPDDDAARAMVVHLHEQANRWGEAVAAGAARIERASDPIAKAALLIAEADVQRLHLGDRAGALASLQTAHALDPGRAGLAEAISALLADDAPALRAWLARMAEAAEGESRALLLGRTAELDELVLADDAAAADAYRKALDAFPGDAWLASRLAAVGARMRYGAVGTKKKPAAQHLEPESFEDALALLNDGAAEAALTALESAAAASPTSLPALRALAAVARAGDAMPLLANALEQQLAALETDHSRLVALWAEAAIVAWRLPENDSYEVYERILQRAPGDRAALDSLLRRALPRSANDAASRGAAIRALGALLAHAPDDSTRLANLLELAALLETDGDRAGALARYREAMQRRSALSHGSARHGTPRRSAARHGRDGRRGVRARRPRRGRPLARRVPRASCGAAGSAPRRRGPRQGGGAPRASARGGPDLGARGGHAHLPLAAGRSPTGSSRRCAAPSHAPIAPTPS